MKKCELAKFFWTTLLLGSDPEEIEEFVANNQHHLAALFNPCNVDA
jgi:hypothetical protein